MQEGANGLRPEASCGRKQVKSIVLIPFRPDCPRMSPSQPPNPFEGNCFMAVTVMSREQAANNNHFLGIRNQHSLSRNQSWDVHETDIPPCAQLILAFDFGL
jgi:hypothetical protein